MSVKEEEKKLREYIIKLFSKETIEDLKTINPFRTLFSFLHIWISLIISYFLIFYIVHSFGLLSALFLIPLSVFIATRLNALAVQIHEASHFLLFSSKKINDIFCNYFGAYWILNNVESYRKTHLKHHRHLHTENDPDKDLYEIYNNDKTRSSPIFYFIQDIFLITALKRIKTYYKEKKTNRNDVNSEYIKHIFFKVLTQILILSLFFAIFNPLHALFLWFAFWFIPLFCFFPVIIRIRIVAEHFLQNNAQGRSFVSRTTNGNRIINYLLGACMEYHFEHHLIPYIPHYNLKIINKNLNLDNNTLSQYQNKGYINYWLKTIKSKPI